MKLGTPPISSSLALERADSEISSWSTDTLGKGIKVVEAYAFYMLGIEEVLMVGVAAFL